MISEFQSLVRIFNQEGKKQSSVWGKSPLYDIKRLRSLNLSQLFMPYPGLTSGVM